MSVFVDPNPLPSDASIVEIALKPLRDALRPQGTSNLTSLRLDSACMVNGDLAQKAIDEIIQYHTILRLIGEPESACMQLAKMVLTDSAYMTNAGYRG